MRKSLMIAFGAALVGGAFSLSTAPASALPLSAGVSLADIGVNSMIEKVQVRRRIVRRRGGGINPGAAAVIGLGVAGVAAAIIANDRRDRERERQQRIYQQQQYYGYPYGQQPVYAPQPVCGYQQQPVYDRFGNYRGTRQVQVCQ